MSGLKIIQSKFLIVWIGSKKYSGQNYAKKLNKYGQLTLSFSVFNQMQINCRTVDKEKLNPKVTLIKLLLIILQLIKATIHLFTNTRN